MKPPKKNIKKTGVKKSPSADGNKTVAGTGDPESEKRFVDEEDDEYDLPIDELGGFDELDSFADDEDY